MKNAIGAEAQEKRQRSDADAKESTSKRDLRGILLPDGGGLDPYKAAPFVREAMETLMPRWMHMDRGELYTHMACAMVQSFALEQVIEDLQLEIASLRMEVE